MQIKVAFSTDESKFNLRQSDGRNREYSYRKGESFNGTCLMEQGQFVGGSVMGNGISGNIITNENHDKHYLLKPKCCEVSKPHSSENGDSAQSKNLGHRHSTHYKKHTADAAAGTHY